MIGSLQGNWAFFLLCCAVLFVIAVAAHVVWAWRIGGGIWRSDRPIPLRLMLMALATVTPIVAFYATRLLHIRTHPAISGDTTRRTFRLRALLMPALGLSAVLAFALAATFRYSPQFRSLQVFLGFIPGILSFYIVMQLILFMAATVFGFSRRGILTSRTHLVSVVVILILL